MKTPVLVALLIITALVSFTCGALLFGQPMSGRGDLSGTADAADVEPTEAEQLLESAHEYFGTSPDPEPAAIADVQRRCPWTISAIVVGKWADGKLKDSLWVRGNFPILPGAFESPRFYVNGNDVGYSRPFFDLRTLLDASKYLKKGTNEVTLKFSKERFKGRYDTYTFEFDPDEVEPRYNTEF